MFTLDRILFLLLIVFILCNLLPLRRENFKNVDELSKCLKTNAPPNSTTSNISKCYQKYLEIPNKDIESFKKCMESSGFDDNSIQTCMPELAVSEKQINTPSPASGDFNVTNDMYNLVSNIAPQDIARGLGKETFSNKYATPNDGFLKSGHQIQMTCMSDPYKHCFNKYGTSGWQAFSQCVQSGEGMM